MPSPFPGMDPYLEGRLWPDVHGSLIYTIRAALAAQLPPGYFASIDQYVWLSEADSEDGVVLRTRLDKPDTVVTGERTESPSGTVVTTTPSARVRLASPRMIRQKRYIRLIDAEDRTVITVLELLSPSDKSPKQDRMHYLAKRDEYLAAGVNLVETDLLRKGLRVPMGEPEPPDADYYILVSRARDYPNADVWAFTVREPIPVFPVPLRDDETPVSLNLRNCLDKAYDDARYDLQIDCTQPPEIPLRKPDAEWAAELLRSRTSNSQAPQP